jgi:hypothetical protein
MVDTRDEILSAMRGVGEAIRPKPAAHGAETPAVNIDIGGINLKKENAFEHAHADRSIDPPLMAAAPSEDVHSSASGRISSGTRRPLPMRSGRDVTRKPRAPSAAWVSWWGMRLRERRKRRP